jgi:hypothetical protein
MTEYPNYSNYYFYEQLRCCLVVVYFVHERSRTSCSNACLFRRPELTFVVVLG